MVHSLRPRRYASTAAGAPVSAGAYDEPPMDLHYLDFDFSGDAHGDGSFDAMASAAPAQWPALEAEVLRVLDWAEGSFGPAAALDEGGTWDFALAGVREVSTVLAVGHAPGATRLELEAGLPDPPRVTLTLTVSGTADFCAAFRQAFGIG